MTGWRSSAGARDASACHLTEVGPAPLLGWDRDGIEVELPRLGRTRVGLRGRHQAANAATADALLDALEAAGIAAVRPAARRTGYASAVWAGRLELIRAGGRDVLLDGAHNPAGAAALAVALDDLRPFLADGPLTLVTASMADKDVDGVIARARDRGRARGRDRSCARASTSRGRCPRRSSPRTGARSRARRATSGSSPIRRRRSRRAGGSGPVVVAGSLYLVGMARGQLVDDPDLRDPEPCGGRTG